MPRLVYSELRDNISPSLSSHLPFSLLKSKRDQRISENSHTSIIIFTPTIYITSIP